MRSDSPSDAEPMTSDEIAEIERAYQFDNDPKANVIMRLIADLRRLHGDQRLDPTLRRVQNAPLGGSEVKR